jgi:hypothetical protein
MAANAFLARAYEGKSYALTAKELGVRAANLRQEIHRALPAIQHDVISLLDERPAEPRTILQRLATEGVFTRRRAVQHCQEIRQLLAAYRHTRW